MICLFIKPYQYYDYDYIYYCYCCYYHYYYYILLLLPISLTTCGSQVRRGPRVGGGDYTISDYSIVHYINYDIINITYYITIILQLYSWDASGGCEVNTNNNRGKTPTCRLLWCHSTLPVCYLPVPKHSASRVALTEKQKTPACRQGPIMRVFFVSCYTMLCYVMLYMLMMIIILIYIYIYIYIHTYIHTSLSLYIYIYICIDTHVDVIYIYIYIYIYTWVGVRPRLVDKVVRLRHEWPQLPLLRGLRFRLRHPRAHFGKGRMGSVSTDGVTAVLFDRGTFWALPLVYFYLPEVPGRTFLTNLSKTNTFAAAPSVLTPCTCPQPNIIFHCYILKQTGRVNGRRIWYRQIRSHAAVENSNSWTHRTIETLAVLFQHSVSNAISVL